MSEYASMPRDFAGLTADYVKVVAFEVVGELLFAAAGMLLLLGLAPDAIPYYVAAMAVYASLTALSVATRTEDEEQDGMSESPSANTERELYMFIIGFALGMILTLSTFFLALTGLAIAATTYIGVGAGFAVAFLAPALDLMLFNATGESLEGMIGYGVTYLVVGVFLVAGFDQPDHTDGRSYRGVFR
jgi:heme/copper-type cytochrome/quinol oxidase subunit 4